MNYFKIKTSSIRTLTCPLLAVACLSLASCTTIHRVSEDIGPLIEAGPSYSETIGDTRERLKEQWWLAFGDEELSRLIEKSLGNNFSLKEAYARIKQAKALEAQAGAVKRPGVTGELSGTSEWISDGERTDRSNLQAGLNWEVDLWGKLSSAQKAAVLELEGTREELEGAALLLSSQVAETYFQIVEQRSQLKLLTEQIDASETYLRLIKLRFMNGVASLVDVHQQHQQVASLRAQLPPVRSRAATLGNRLSVLLGMVPAEKEMKGATELPELPKLPETGIPADLLINRPDLRVRHKRLLAADYRVAEAVADRLPGINLGAALGLRSGSLSGQDLFLSIFGEIAGPVVDWGRRRAEVDRRKAVVEEEIALYTRTYLTAIEEVENALNREKEQLALVDALDEQLVISKATLKETRNRYMQGLSDYLPVLTALQSTQGLERDILSARLELISNRILLYRALGGAGFMESNSLALNQNGNLE